MGDAPDSWQDKIEKEPPRVREMVEWFFENFEDPAESTPYESAEGGYQYIYGGPFDAYEELLAQFEDEEEDVEKAVKFLAPWGAEWAPREGKPFHRLFGRKPGEE